MMESSSQVSEMLITAALVFLSYDINLWYFCQQRSDIKMDHVNAFTVKLIELLLLKLVKLGEISLGSG